MIIIVNEYFEYIIYKELKVDIVYIVLFICLDCIFIDCVGIIVIVFIYLWIVNIDIK